MTLEEYRKVATMRRQGNPPASPPATPAENRNPETRKPDAAPPKAAAGGEIMSEARQVEFFEKKIRPVLVSQCYSCHAVDSKDVKGELVLDTREGIRKGGDSGPAVVPGDVAASLLLTAIRHEDGKAMPPKSRLTDDQIADFVAWIENGAFDPRETASVSARSAVDIAKGKEFWAFRPPVNPEVPAVKDRNWPLSDIDRFVRAAQLGYEAVENPMHIHDWHATILHILGLDHEKLTFPHAGRAMRLTDVKGVVHQGVLG